VHLGKDVLVPDLAGWRRENLPQLPDKAFFELRPDWVCEILSPSTQRLDRTRKLPVYARERVLHVWLISPDVQTLEGMRLDGDSYRIVGIYRAADTVHAEPFDAVELELAALWINPPEADLTQAQSHPLTTKRETDVTHPRSITERLARHISPISART
jgi:Uma2 family endonuclease